MTGKKIFSIFKKILNEEWLISDFEFLIFFPFFHFQFINGATTYLFVYSVISRLKKAAGVRAVSHDDIMTRCHSGDGLDTLL